MKKNWNTDTWPQKSWDQETCVHSEGAVPIQQSEPTVIIQHCQEVSVVEQSQAVNIWEEEAVVVSF